MEKKYELFKNMNTKTLKRLSLIKWKVVLRLLRRDKYFKAKDLAMSLCAFCYNARDGLHAYPSRALCKLPQWVCNSCHDDGSRGYCDKIIDDFDYKAGYYKPGYDKNNLCDKIRDFIQTLERSKNEGMNKKIDDINLTEEEQKFYEWNKPSITLMCETYNLDKKQFIQDCLKELNNKKKRE